MASNYNIKAIVTDDLAICLDAASTASYRSSNQAGAVTAQTQYTSEGSYTFTVPDYVNEISAVCIGGGGGGGGSSNTEDGGGGGGGALAWGTITVTPRESLDVTVGEGGEQGSVVGNGEDGGDSKIARSGTTLLQGEGGEGGGYMGASGEGGTSSGSFRLGGGEGGNGATGVTAGGGGGGAGGYEGDGGVGNGSAFVDSSGGDGTGGGGGGGGGSTHIHIARRGGGVGLYGEHDPVANGEGGSSNAYGEAGSGGSNALYGAGGGGSYRGHANSPTAGGVGAVRIVYTSSPLTRKYPEKANVYPSTTFNPTNTSWNDLITLKSGTLSGGVYWSDNKFVYDGTNDRITFPTSILPNGLGATATIEVWNYWNDSSQPSDNPWAGCLYTNSAEGPWNTGAANNNGLLFGYNSIVYSNQASGAEVQVDYSPAPDTQTWHQHVLTLNNGTGTVYVDKTQVMTAGTFRTNYGQSNGTLGIGVADLYSGNYRGEYNGYISVVRIYNKVLSTAEIEENYDATKRRYGL